jgi:hydroxypyruvate isomerase
MITRRSLLRNTAAAAVAAPVIAPLIDPESAHAAPGGGRLKQSACKWCYSKMTLDDLCQNAQRIGLKGIDLVDYKDWPTLKKYGLVPSMTPGAGKIPDGWNRLENHEKLIAELNENVPRAAENNVPNVITFSGNRKGMPDGEGLANCVTGLLKVKKLAEEKGVTVNLELLNSKVNHKDYMADHVAWGAELCKRVDSPRIKLLYDIYHMQIMEGDIIRNIRDNFKYIGHFHTGGNPDRHELNDKQELNWRGIAIAIADLGYQGFYAHEFIPVNPDPMKSLQEAYELSNV